MTARYWWLGIGVLTIAIMMHALVPRYEWRILAETPGFVIRIDRWSGRAEIGVIDRFTPQWEPIRRAAK